MALITCPECNAQVSDKAIACPHCGYPVQEYFQENKIHTGTYDLVLFDAGPNGMKIKCCKLIDECLKVGAIRAKEICESKKEEVLLSNETIKKVQEMKNKFEAIGCGVKIVESDTFNNTINNPRPVVDRGVCCPRCGSTSITTGQRGFSILTGPIGSSKTTNRCAKCGYKWYPK
ncbi:MAG: zinc-ribbon domain-containing protein [Clostridiales bacterium]|nr:zinc-ribbon domain-containing protein [Clostridiales bacterium]